jgi:cytochrome d ubiquinol oxidase subunit I
MHTPAGYEVAATTINGHETTRAVITDFWAMVFNPSSMHRLGHVLLGAFAQGAFFVLSITAYYLLKGRHLEFARRSFGLALAVALVTMVLIPVSGHFQAQVVARKQPAKLAAYEGVFRTGEGGTPIYLVGWPNVEKETIEFGIAIPKVLSFLAYEDFNQPVTGLDKFKPEDRPPVLLPFLNYHVMVAIGLALVLLSVAGAVLWRLGRLERHRWLLWVFVFAVVGPYVANQAGWIAAESGRQPFAVYPEVVPQADGAFAMVGGFRTVDGLSQRNIVTAGQVWASIVLFSIVYLLLFFVWVYVLHKKITHGPDEDVPPPPTSGAKDIYEVAARRGQEDSLTGA